MNIVPVVFVGCSLAYVFYLVVRNLGFGGDSDDEEYDPMNGQKTRIRHEGNI